MLCEICKRKEATFFIKETMLGETKTHALCEDCAKKHKDTIMPSNMQIEKLIQSLISFTEDELEKDESKKITKKQKSKKCPKCGSTYEEVVLSKIAGCSECYKTFSSEIDELINKVARNVSYHGAKPKSTKTRKTNEEDTSKLIREYKKDLNEAIMIEDYDKAAKLRDLIKTLEGKDDKKVSVKKETKTKETKSKTKSVKKTSVKKNAKGKKNDNSK